MISHFFTAPINTLLACGNIGTDIFIFLSAISCYFSFHRHSDCDSFYLRRLIRIVPSYMVVGSISWLVLDLFKGKGLYQYFYDLSLYSFWKDGEQLFYYVAISLFLYLIFPFIYHILFDDKKDTRILFAILFIFTISVNAYLKNIMPSAYDNIEIGITRIPVFLVGCIMAPQIYQKKTFCNSFYFLGIIISIFSLYICTTGYFPGIGFRYTYGILAVSLCISISVLLAIIPWKSVHSVLIFFGNMSLELYIIHIALRKIFIRSSFYDDYCLLEYLGILCISVILSYLLTRVTHKVISKGKFYQCIFHR